MDSARDEVRTDPARSPETIREFCLSVLEQGDLSAKLAPPVDRHGDPLPDSRRGRPFEIERPARAAGLRMTGGSDSLPRPGELGDPTHRIRCLSRFAHHELMAVELFAWALLRWPEVPEGLRRGWLSALIDEQRHCRLYLARLEAHGGRFDTDDHSDYFWRQSPTIAASDSGASAFLAAMGLTLEQANLDFTLTYRDAFAEAGDHESARVCQTVHDEEIAHVALAAHWIKRLGQRNGGEPDRDTSDLDGYLAAVPFPLGPARAKGRRFEVGARRRAGLSEKLIEHVRVARSSQQQAVPNETLLLPNLGAEEGEDWHAIQTEPRVDLAARLWCLLFAADACLYIPGKSDGESRKNSCRDLWPAGLGAVPERAVFDWLAKTRAPLAWLNTATLERENLALGRQALAGPSASVVNQVHDKAFAIETARELELDRGGLERCLRVIDAESLQSPDAAIEELDRVLREWPDWMHRKFTLKPRFGSSGRGRVGGDETLNRDSVRGAFPRLAARGGAIFEPWLERRRDLSVALLVPTPEEKDAVTILLGSLEMLNTAGGVYRGHCGEIDSRGRVFSGHAEDETLRADAAAVANRARQAEFSGPCGVDAFIYVDGDGRERLRSLVEFNARMTMGLVTIGLVRRALPEIRESQGLSPGERHGFLLTFVETGTEHRLEALLQASGEDAIAIRLDSDSLAHDVRPVLVFARDRNPLRQAHRDIFGC